MRRSFKNEEDKFRDFLEDHQRSKDVSLVRELIGSALENGHVFEGWSDDEIVNDMLVYADFEIEKFIGPTDNATTRTRLLSAIDSIRHEIY